MPNWCSNVLTINGDKQTIKTIKNILWSLRPETKTPVEKLEEEKIKVLQSCTDDLQKERLAKEFDLKLGVLRNQAQKPKNKSVFHNLIGLPAGVSQEEYDANWYDNNIERYGTKWDIDFDEYEWDLDGDEYISATFQTAWSPCEGFVRHLAERFTGITEIQLDYEECGCDFAGRLSIVRDEELGLLIDDDCCKYEEGVYKYDVDCFWNRFEEDLLEYELEENEYTLEDIVERFKFVSKEDMEYIKKQVTIKLIELNPELNEQ